MSHGPTLYKQLQTHLIWDNFYHSSMHAYEYTSNFSQQKLSWSQSFTYGHLHFLQLYTLRNDVLGSVKSVYSSVAGTFSRLRYIEVSLVITVTLFCSIENTGSG